MKYISTLLLLVVGMAGISAYGLSPEEVRMQLHKARPDIPVSAVRESDVKGLYEAVLPGGQILYVTEDGGHFIAGDLYEVTDAGFVNLTEAQRSESRRELIGALDDSEKLVFSPPEDQVKATINVFTDVDCGYCRKLHRDMDELNELGIAVKYMAYPRGGRQAKSWDKTVSVWCSEEPKKALTRAKLGEDIPQQTCDNPVAKEYELGNRIGVTGTPAIVYSDGTLQPGYLPPKRLAARLGIE